MSNIEKLEKGRIDYRLLAIAVDFYESKGYRYIEVPWLTDISAISKTIPKHVRALHVDYTNHKYNCLVGSAEQSFIQMVLNDELSYNQKYVAITPCFRNETVFDELHYPYFMKVELFQLGRCDTFIDDAIKFIELNTDIIPKIIKTHIGYDIIDSLSGIELGSYGNRWFSAPPDNIHLISYGTGCAEPRMSYVNKLKYK